MYLNVLVLVLVLVLDKCLLCYVFGNELYDGTLCSAAWCGPCRAFTPKLAERYHALKEANKDIEIIFVSADHDQQSFNEYSSKMPWLSLPFKYRRVAQMWGQQYGVKGYPTLLLLDGPTGTLFFLALPFLCHHH